MMIPKQKLLPFPSSEPQAGFTIIECLLAIIIVAVLMVAIAPAIALSVATRVQARRVELATQAARTYVDGVQSGAIDTPQNVVLVDLKQPPAGAPPNPNDPRIKFSSTDPPQPTLNCPIPPNLPAGAPLPAGYYCQNTPNTPPNPEPASLYCINLDGKGCVSTNRPAQNFVVQAFRSVTPDPVTPTQPNPSDNGTAGYLLGVRVYRIDAFDGGSVLTKTAIGTTAKRQLAYTAGVGDRKAPLVEFTTEVRGDDTNWDSLCDRLGGCTTAPSASPSPSPTVSP